MKAAIIGYATEGVSSAKYWLKKGYDITICDMNGGVRDDTLPYSWQLGEDYLQDLDRFDVIVRTAGIHPGLIAQANPGVDVASKTTSNINEFLAACPTNKIIGVTGTKGKGTTSSLIAKMLENSGEKVHLGGNIGYPALDMLPEITAEDWVVLELGCFQLMDLTLAPHIMVCLMVVAEHLDWHTDLAEYISAKRNGFLKQKSDSIAIYNGLSDFSGQVASSGPAETKLRYCVPPLGQEPQITEAAYVLGSEIYYSDTLIGNTDIVKLRGRHNLENVCAAITAVANAVELNIEAIAKTLQEFGGLEHRIEFVRELDGVKYFNDSFATTPETAIACIRAFSEPKIVILGGHDKGIPFDQLASEVASSNIRHAIVIGDTALEIANLLQNRGYFDITTGLSSMKEIVDIARVMAQSGDVVLLSTGCASFGLFKDYKDRGNQFKQYVQSLS